MKSTLHLYCPASTPITSSILKVAGNVSGRKWARAPSHFSSDQMTDVDKASEDVNTSSPPTSILQKKEKRIHDNASNNYFCLVSGTPNTYVKANCFHFFFATLWVSEKSVFSRIQACKAMVSRKNWYCSSANSIMSGKWHLKRKCYSGISSFSLRLLAKKPDSSKSRVAGAMRISKFWLLLQNSPEYM